MPSPATVLYRSTLSTARLTYFFPEFFRFAAHICLHALGLCLGARHRTGPSVSWRLQQAGEQPEKQRQQKDSSEDGHVS